MSPADLRQRNKGRLSARWPGDAYRRYPGCLQAIPAPLRGQSAPAIKILRDSLTSRLCRWSWLDGSQRQSAELRRAGDSESIKLLYAYGFMESALGLIFTPIPGSG